MASGENQGLQIALIVFVILTILLGVATFFSFRSYQEQEQANKTLDADAKKDRTAATTAQTEMNQMKEMMGLDPGLSFTDVQARFTEDMTKYAASFPPGTLPEAKRHYRQALEVAALGYSKSSADLVDARAEIENLKQINETRERAKEPQIAQHVNRAKAAEADRDALKTTFEEDRSNLNKDKAELAAKATDKDTKLTELEASKKTEIDKRDTDLLKVAKILEDRTKTIDEMMGKGFEVPDGEIRSVNAGTRTVWINLGRADQLRRQTTFSVYDAEANTRAEPAPKPKGSIEVTQVLNEHMSVARILDDEVTNPIVNGDKIYTPLWHPGRGEHFAIMGKIDLNGDGVADLDIVKNMISMAGGEIDAELDAKTGTVVGHGINRSTRYLLIGDFAEFEKTVVKGAEAMEAEADRWGVRKLDVPKFLDLVGWKDPKQVLRFGRGGNAEFQVPDQPDGGRPVSPSYLTEQFKKRRPPSALKGSAYDAGTKAVETKPKVKEAAPTKQAAPKAAAPAKAPPAKAPAKAAAPAEKQPN